MAKAAAKSAPASTDVVLSVNRRASFDYEVIERYEAGIAFTGSEVKSVREGRISLAEAYAAVERGEAWLIGAHVAEYVLAHRRNHEPMRRRKLLLHRREIDKIGQAVQRDGLTLIPLKVYTKGRNIKVELGLCRGKQVHDKREKVKERQHKREMDREMRERRR
ncbi:MAG TPA: SsrA-binding protein SmpB [Nannocystaceae bacterium]|nr:SsrA-binding protein SmpB [Nannocystaceae bacterium]